MVAGFGLGIGAIAPARGCAANRGPRCKRPLMPEQIEDKPAGPPRRGPAGSGAPFFPVSGKQILDIPKAE